MKLVLMLIWLGLFFEIFILAIMKPYISDFELMSNIAVFIHVLFTMALLIAYKDKHVNVFIGAFLARISLLLWDIYASHIYILPNSGDHNDAGMFARAAVRVSEDISLLSGFARGGVFTKTQGLLFHWIGPQLMFGQYINVLLGLSVVFIVYRIMVLLELKPRVIFIIILIAAFFPNSMVMSAIFLREMPVTFFVASSLYFFIKWFKLGHNTDMLFSVVLLSFASALHSGVVGIFFGYAFMFLFYKQESKRFCLHSKAVYVLLFLIAFIFISVTFFGNTILNQFVDAEGNFDIDIYATADVRRGESVYLTDISINNPIQLIIYGPLKTFYFLTSPLPMDWRGLMDAFSFFYDSLFYLGTIGYLILNWRNFKDKKVLVVGLVLILVCVSIVFGIGVSNAGTAIRHRQKIIPIFLIMLAVMMDCKQRLFEKRKKEDSGGDRFNGTLAKRYNTSL